MKPAAILVLATALTTIAAARAADEAELVEDPFSDEAQQPEKPRPTQAAFVFEWIELDHRLANKLIRKHGDQLSARPLREQLGKMIKAKQAELVQTAYLNTQQDQRAKTQSVDEHIYPTEYDPPEIPMEIRQSIRAGELVIIPAIPTAFDLRYVGTMVEIEPDISDDGKKITLNLAPEIVDLLRDRGVGGNAKQVPAPLAVIKLPTFYVTKLNSAITLNANDFTLAGMLTPPGKPGKRVLLIVRNKISY